MVAPLGAVHARVQRVVIERVRDHTFFATVTVASGGEVCEVDARPSDALNLALRCDAPIHVAADPASRSGGAGSSASTSASASASGRSYPARRRARPS